MSKPSQSGFSAFVAETSTMPSEPSRVFSHDPNLPQLHESSRDWDLIANAKAGAVGIFSPFFLTFLERSLQQLEMKERVERYNV